jgi:hypothetical protein
MLWKITPTPVAGDRSVPTQGSGRFVLHRHADAQGPHLDLRLEAGPCLLGWRVDGPDLNHERYAVDKAPHPTHWLDRDGDAVREDAGVYAWIDQDDDGGTLELRGERGTRWLRIQREPTLTPSALGALLHAIRAQGFDPVQVPVLVHDGQLARHRAMLRLCALGRELDGAAFDESRWRTLLAHASLDEIHHHLRAYEVRFDAKYPPQPTSQPERLPDDAPHDRHKHAHAILKSA